MPDLLTQVATAIRSVQGQVLWKPGSDIRHLQKRKRRGHLHNDATVADYEQLIRSVASNQYANVYVYHHEDSQFIAIVATLQVQSWLVMFGLDGVLESAFVLERPDLYMDKPTFKWLGTVGDLIP
jgi:hypothetical protein